MYLHFMFQDLTKMVVLRDFKNNGLKENIFLAISQTTGISVTMK